MGGWAFLLIWLAISAVSLGVFSWLVRRAPYGFQDRNGFHHSNSDPVTPSQVRGDREAPKAHPVATDQSPFHDEGSN